MMAGTDLRIADGHPEDAVLCRQQRHFLEQTHGVSFAPPRLARRFAYGRESPKGLTFGFHGADNLPDMLDEAALQEWLHRLPDAFFLGEDAHRMARALLRRGMPRAAQQLLQRRQAAGQAEVGTRLLGAAASVMGLLSSRSG
jgi:hypothetical protein